MRTAIEALPRPFFPAVFVSTITTQAAAAVAIAAVAVAAVEGDPIAGARRLGRSGSSNFVSL